MKLVHIFLLWFLIIVFFQVINVQVTNQESAQADWNAQLDDFEKLMLLKALKEEKVNLLFRDKHRNVNTVYTVYTFIGFRWLGNEPGICQYINML